MEHLAVKVLMMNRKARLLVVDDEEIARKNLAHVLTKENYDVVTAADGETALRELESQEFDVVLADLRMGRIDGMELLDRIRILDLKGARVPNPSFYSDAQALGVANLPSLPHLASLTFVDVVVFNDGISERTLFHGLVHAAQLQVLGLDRYAELFVRGFLRTGSHVTVPLETHAFALDSRFVKDSEGFFSVEEQIRLWLRENRY